MFDLLYIYIAKENNMKYTIKHTNTDNNWKGGGGAHSQYSVSSDGKKIGHATVDHESQDVHGGIDWDQHPKAVDAIKSFHNETKTKQHTKQKFCILP